MISLLSKSQIQKFLGSSTIVKSYPPSGQKQVLLVNDNEHGMAIFKFVKNGDERIQREIEIVTKYEIRNVPKIIDVREIKTDDNEIFISIIEQYIEGETLDEKLKNRKLSTSDGLKLLKILIEISVQLEMKEINVVHRDIKPSNIICGVDENYYLIDFGIARQLNGQSLTMTHAKIGPISFAPKVKSVEIRAIVPLAVFTITTLTFSGKSSIIKSFPYASTFCSLP